jgi:sulfatase modifying factor 1
MDRRCSIADRPARPLTLTDTRAVRSTRYVTRPSRVLRPLLVLAAPLAVAVAACTGIIGLPDVPDLVLADAETFDVAVPTDGARLDANASDATSDAKTKSDADADAATDSGEGGTSTQAASCAGRTGPGIDDCGPFGVGGKGTDSCCASPLVNSTGNLFHRSFSANKTNLSAPAMVSAFRLDKYEVTVGRFRAFVAAVQGGYMPATGSGKHSHIKNGSGLSRAIGEGGYEQGWIYAIDPTMKAFLDASLAEASSAGGHTPKSTYHATPPDERRPVNVATWEEAYAFCIWDGGFLPSEAEWIYAAANGSAQLMWPWGPDDPLRNTNYAIIDFNYPAGNTKTNNTVNQIAPVGFSIMGASAFGQYDLTGNLQEYVLDRTGGGFPNNVATPPSCVDCTTFAGGEVVVRGGNYGDPPNGATGNTVRGQGPSDRRDYQGFRCARSPL